MMTKKDYIRAADIVRAHFEARPRVMPVEALTETFVAFFRGDNPRFDVDRFREACRGES